MAIAGYVYILSNPSMPGIIKVGRTSDDPHKRSIALSAPTGVPTPFIVEWHAYVENTERIESIIHKCFSKYRINSSREFFRIDINLSKNECERICAEECEIYINNEFFDKEVCQKELDRKKNENEIKRKNEKKKQRSIQLNNIIRTNEHQLLSLERDLEEKRKHPIGGKFQLITSIAMIIVLWLDEIFPYVKAHRDIQVWAFILVPIGMFFLYKVSNSPSESELMGMILETNNRISSAKYELTQLENQ